MVATMSGPKNRQAGFFGQAALLHTVWGLAVRLCTAPTEQAGRSFKRLLSQHGGGCVPVYALNVVALGLLDPLPYKRGRARALSLGSFEGVEGPQPFRQLTRRFGLGPAPVGRRVFSEVRAWRFGEQT